MLKPEIAVTVANVAESAAFGRLRVETAHLLAAYQTHASAAFGRLRVETTKLELSEFEYDVSRLRAAAC